MRRVPAAATRPLRRAVLRPGQPAETALFAGDEAVGAAHFAAYAGEDVVGVASLYPESRPGGPHPGWRLRGMATDPDHRGRGVGRSVLTACIAHAAAEAGAEVWCNARLVAVEFYRRGGFEIVSDEFDIPGIGPHFVMRRLLDGGSPERPEQQ